MVGGLTAGGPISGLALPLLLSFLQIRRGWKNREALLLWVSVWSHGNSSFYICPSLWDPSNMLIMENEGAHG